MNGPFLTTAPSQASFAARTVGTGSTATAILLENMGNASLTISGISVTAPNSSDFSQANNCGSSLPVAGSCTVNVTFSPTAAGSRKASIAIADNVVGSPLTVALSGIGIAAPDYSVGTASGSSTSQTISDQCRAKLDLQFGDHTIGIVQRNGQLELQH